VWDNFDRRMKAKAANDPSSEASAKDEGGDMFSAAGVAAE
jgi:ribonucleoside-diphosphate reductase beta chain